MSSTNEFRPTPRAGSRHTKRMAAQTVLVVGVSTLGHLKRSPGLK